MRLRVFVHAWMRARARVCVCVSVCLCVCVCVTGRWHHAKLQRGARYVAEGIEWEAVDYFNNKIVCEMIDVRKGGDVGLFALIDDASSQQHNTDSKLLDDMTHAFAEHPHFRKGVKARSATDFTVVHYAGEVSYTITGFLDKNRDMLCV
jgi:myosin heavy subunit